MRILDKVRSLARASNREYARAEECAAAASRGSTSAFIGLARFTGWTSLHPAIPTLLPPLAARKRFYKILFLNAFMKINARPTETAAGPEYSMT